MSKQRGTGSHLGFNTEDLFRSLNLVVGLEQILDVLSAYLCELFNADATYLLLLEPITQRYNCQRVKGPYSSADPAVSFGQTDRLVKWLGVNSAILDVESDNEVVAYLSVREQEMLKSLNVALVLPFVAVNRLTGMAFLSRTRNGARFTTAERESLLGLANHAALVLENAVLNQLQEERLRNLFHADKLASVGELAAGAAHEIRNPLTSIRSTVQYLRKDVAESKQPLVDGIIEEVDRIDGIIQGLLSLSRSATIQATAVDIPDLVHSMLSLLDSELRSHEITVKEVNRLADGVIEGDPAQLKQVFLNIILNSIQATPESGGSIAVTLDEIRQGTAGNEEGNAILVKISDTGTGIASEDLVKVFDPFFTSKENGTGLGLSIAYGIVSKHGGSIAIESTTRKPDNGTTVSVRLPKRIAAKKLSL